MFSRSSTNRKRSALSSIANVHQNNNNKRIKLEPNQNSLSTNGKRNSAALSSITSNDLQDNHNNIKRIKLCNQLQQQVNVNLILRSAPIGALHLNHLPFDCVSSIFDRIPLHQRITRLSLVCHHWKSTVDEMCHLKGELTLNLFSNYKPSAFEFVFSDLEKYWSNVRHERMESLIIVKPRNGKFTLPDLSVRFPQVTQLVIRSNDTTEQQNRASLHLFLSLLGGQQQEWCSSVTSLTLYKMTKITDPTFLPQLSSMINHKFIQSSLKHLNLYIQAFGAVTRACHPERAKLRNLLPQLERFFVVSPFKNWPSVMRTLGKCGANGQITSSVSKVREINLCEHIISLENLTNLLAQTQFTSTVTHLHISTISSRAWFNLICESFGFLQFLQINVGNYKFNADWFNELSKLTRLTELKMHRFQLDPTTVNNIVPLATVKKLTIYNSELLTQFRVDTGSSRFNAFQYCRLLSHHFPSVSVLILVCNEKCVTMAERNIRKWAKVHFKQIEKVVLVLNAEEYRTDRKVRQKFMREYRKLSQN